MTEIDFLVGVDLGQLRDFTAVCVTASPVWIPAQPFADPQASWPQDESLRGWVSPLKLPAHTLQYFRQHNDYYGRPPHPPLDVVHLERFERGTKYPAVVERVDHLMTKTPLNQGARQLLADATGVGRPVVDMFDAAGLSPLAVTITGGASVSREADGAGFHVAQRELIGATVAAVESRRLRINSSLKEARTLTDELTQFQRRINAKSITESFGAWREGEHDDLLFSLAMTVWYRDWYFAHYDAQMAQRERAAAETGIYV